MFSPFSPDYAPESSDEDDEDIGEHGFKKQKPINQASSVTVAQQASSSAAEMEDRRLRRLQERAAQSDDDDEDDDDREQRYVGWFFTSSDGLKFESSYAVKPVYGMLADCLLVLRWLKKIENSCSAVVSIHMTSFVNR